MVVTLYCADVLGNFGGNRVWAITMANTNALELLRYKDIRTYAPKVGDVIVAYGWLRRTKWFGVINEILSDGSVSVVREGSIRLLATTTPDRTKAKSLIMSKMTLVGSFPGAYSILQQDPQNNLGVWYI
jgi:hypothetical protein